MFDVFPVARWFPIKAYMTYGTKQNLNNLIMILVNSNIYMSIIKLHLALYRKHWMLETLRRLHDFLCSLLIFSSRANNDYKNTTIRKVKGVHEWHHTFLAIIKLCVHDNMAYLCPMNILYRPMIDFIALIKHFPFLTYRYEGLGVGFWTWGLELVFLSWRF